MFCPKCGENKSVLEYEPYGSKGIFQIPYESHHEDLFSIKVETGYDYECKTCGYCWRKVDKIQ